MILRLLLIIASCCRTGVLTAMLENFVQPTCTSTSMVEQFSVTGTDLSQCTPLMTMGTVRHHVYVKITCADRTGTVGMFADPSCSSPIPGGHTVDETNYVEMISGRCYSGSNLIGGGITYFQNADMSNVHYPPCPVITTTAIATTTIAADAAAELRTPVQAGDSVLHVSDTTGFAVGRQVILDEGTPYQEVNYIAGFGSLILKLPLQFPHSASARISMPQLPVGTTTPIGTTTPMVTPTPAGNFPFFGIGWAASPTPPSTAMQVADALLPQRLYSKNEIHERGGNMPQSSSILWLGSGGFCGIVVLMLVRGVRSRSRMAYMEVGSGDADSCEEGME